MGELIVAAAFLWASHFGISSSRLRPALVGRIGETPYLVLYSLIALVAIFWLARAYDGAPYVELWYLGWAPWVAAVGMLLASILAVAGVTSASPTALGQASALEGSEPAHGIVRVTRHPFFWAVGLWAIVHILANGDLASLVMFGAFGALGLVGTVLQDAKKAARFGERWRTFAEHSSNLPFLAIAQGRQRLAVGEIGWMRLLGGVVLYAVLQFLHPWLFGVAVHPG